MTTKTALRIRPEIRPDGLPDMDTVQALADPELTIETITPDDADAWLALNVNNRSLSQATIDAYARDMQAGAWRMTGDPIRFDTEGNLIDGQHRLTACLLASVAFRSVVMRNVPPEAKDSIDQCRPRKVPDILKMRGTHYAHRLSSTARVMWDLKHPENRGMRVTSHELLSIIERHPKLAESVALVDPVPSRRLLSKTQLAALHYIGKHVLDEAEKADAFVGVMISGIPARKNDPAHKFRERALASRMSPALADRRAQFYAMVHCFNLFLAGRTVGRFIPPRAANVAVVGLDAHKI